MSGDPFEGLGQRDPSVPLALAALARDAADDGSLAFAELVLGYREAFLVCYRSAYGGADPELTGDQVRENLLASVLPRLAEEGWIEPQGADGWALVRSRGEWWIHSRTDRQGVRARLLGLAEQGFLAPEVAAAPAAERRVVPSGSILEGTGLVKSFRRRRVVNDVSVRVQQGEIVGLLGPNGAGKTTTFYLITGLIQPDEGEVRLDDRDLTTAPMYQRARAGIGYLAQEPSVFRRLTVEENILAILELLPIGREERRRRLEQLLDELSLKHLRKSRAYSLSGGERRRLEITRALVTNPKFMLLDEPFAGVDPIAVHDIQTIVAGLRHRGIGVLITDHNVEQTLDIVDRAYIMFEGRVQVSGPVRDLVFDDRVAELYLGPTLAARLRARLEPVA
ncbi:MAG TPA: LPS export ABC transporter ATP-binding protein [Gemmatimonadales bacterium]|nr:LPS export ABC transporter ATP-binding protein [Gemmatimonadales bacterium]